MRLRHLAVLIAALWLGLSACSPPAPALPARQAATNTVTPLSPTSTPQLPPTISTQAETSCYGGPGEDSVLIATFPQGQQLDLVGKDDYGEYRVVIDPASRIGCWLKREDTVAQGITDYLPNLVPPPTPFADQPSAPGNLTAVLDSCGRVPNHPPMQWTVVIMLRWEDNSSNESYFRVFKTGYLLEYLDADVTQYKDVFTITGVDSGQARYGVDAYARDGGLSGGVETEVQFQCR